MKRKQFIRSAAALIGLPALILPMACKHEIPAAPPRRLLMEVDLGLDLKNTGDIVQDLLRGIYVKRIGPGNQAASFICFSLACTHSGCIIALQASGEFHCPCHGSKFHANGTVLAGPAARSLDRFTIEVKNDKLFIYP